MDVEHISRFGFLPNPTQSYDADGMSLDTAELAGFSTLHEVENNNPDLFPVGFVRTRNFTDRATNRTSDMLGLTCAACHVGQINYDGVGYRIDGGPAMTDLGKFRSAVSGSLGLTYLSGLVSFMPIMNRRWNRFADRVLGDDRTREQTADLKTWMGSLAARGKATADVEKARNIYPVEEGFARLDAIERIGNFVFAEELDSVVNSVNRAQASAPVNFPHIWDSPWFEWVQYNASFMQPLMRNAGEAMGVYADVDLQSVDDSQTSGSASHNSKHIGSWAISSPAGCSMTKTSAVPPTSAAHNVREGLLSITSAASPPSRRSRRNTPRRLPAFADTPHQVVQRGLELLAQERLGVDVVVRLPERTDDAPCNQNSTSISAYTPVAATTASVAVRNAASLMRFERPLPT